MPSEAKGQEPNPGLSHSCVTLGALLTFSELQVHLSVIIMIIII